MKNIRPLLLACLLIAPAVHAGPDAGPPLLKKGARVAVVGDSITEQKAYSRFLEDYLLMCLPELDLKVVQLGWGGETAGGFLNRMNNDLLPWKPDVVTTCYGMNDGGYKPFDEATGKRYADPLAEIVKRCKAAGAAVVVGSPGCVDSKYFRKGPDDAAMYNATLGRLRELAQKTADAQGQAFADVLTPMLDAMAKGKAAHGDAYDVGGRDGVHPGPNGHLVMAYAFLKGLGVDGHIGTITWDVAAGAATATDGHKVLSADPGKVEVESAKWPFCFTGDEKSPGGTRSILPFVPFNQDLNRFVLVVKGLPSPKAKVTWGATSKSFAKADLEKGVNLAAEFFDTPFSAAFLQVDGKVFKKQVYETALIKQTVNSFPRLLDAGAQDPELAAAVAELRARAFAVHDRLHREIRAAITPVKHAITVAPE